MIKSKLAFKAISFAIIALANPQIKVVDAATYHVATTGSDSNTCDQAQNPATPKRTINAALDCAGEWTTTSAGNAVQIADGTYVEGLVNQIPSGLTSYANAFTLKAENRGGVIIQPIDSTPNTLSGTAILGWNGSGVNVQYIIIDGLDLNGVDFTTPANGIRSSSGTTCKFNHVRMTHLTIRNVTGNGFLGEGCDFEILNSKIGPTGDPSGFNHALYLSTRGERWLVERNEVFSFHGYGLHYYSSSCTSCQKDGIIRYNIFRDGGLGVNQSGGIVVGSGHLIHDNLFYGNRGNGLFLAAFNNGKIYNNVFYDNGQAGGSSDSRAGIREKSNSFSNTYSNNISLDNGAGAAFVFLGILRTEETNLSTGTATDIWTDPANGDFTLKSGSAAIDAGVTLTEVTRDYAGTPRPQGAAYDLGALEYIGGSGGSPPVAPGSLTIKTGN